MTFQEMQLEVFRRLEEDSASPAFVTLQDVKDHLNEGLEELSDATEWYEVSQTVTQSTSTYYDLSTLLSKPFLAVKKIFNTITGWWMVPGDYRELDGSYFRWERDTGAPEKFWIRALWWLGQWPKASAASSGLRIYHSAIPSAMSANSDTPGFPQEFHLGIVDYATYEILALQKEFKKALGYWADYQAHEKALGLWVQSRIQMDRTLQFGEEWR
jgi:hypothetical protein